MAGKGSKPRKGSNNSLYGENLDKVDWSVKIEPTKRWIHKCKGGIKYELAGGVTCETCGAVETQ